MKVLAVTVLAFGVAGCDAIGEPSRPDLFFRYAPAVADGRAQARRQPGGLDITGTIRTPCVGYNARGTMTVSGRVVVLRVAARQNGACAADEVGYLTYFASGSLRSGSYQVRVVHEWPNSAWTREVALDTELVVGR